MAICQVPQEISPDFPIPLPPLAEQKAIVKRGDELMALRKPPVVVMAAALFCASSAWALPRVSVPLPSPVYGTARIDKHGHWLSRSRNCRMLLDGNVIQEGHP